MNLLDVGSPQRYIREQRTAGTFFGDTLESLKNTGLGAYYDESLDRGTLFLNIAPTVVYPHGSDENGVPYPLDRVLSVAESEFKSNAGVAIASFEFGQRDNPAPGDGLLEVNDFATGAFSLMVHFPGLSTLPRDLLVASANSFALKALSVRRSMDLVLEQDLATLAAGHDLAGLESPPQQTEEAYPEVE